MPPAGSLWRVKHPTIFKKPDNSGLALSQNDRFIVVSCRFDEKYKREAGFSVYDALSSTRSPDQIWEYSFDMSLVVNVDPQNKKVTWNTESFEKIQRAFDDMMPMTCLYELLSRWYKHFERLE